MELNLFENLKERLESNTVISNISKFINEISNSQNHTHDLNLEKDSENTLKEHSIENMEENFENAFESQSRDIQHIPYLKEGHLYLVTEDRKDVFYIWDFTDKPKKEFTYNNPSQELLEIAKEGTLLKFNNGKLEFHSYDGYNLLFEEKKNTI